MISKNKVSLLNRRCLAVLLCLVAGLHGRPACADRVDLQSLDNALLVDLLTTAELVVEEERANTLLRVYRLRDNPPTCVDQPTSCPNERLFISLAERHGQEQAVFVLPYAFGWQNPQFEGGVGNALPCSTLIPHRFVKMDVERVSRDGELEEEEIFFNMYEAWFSP